MQITVSRNYNLSKLHKWLDYELSGSTLLILSYFFTPAIILAVVAAIAFIPLLVKVLILERKYGWLLFLILLIGILPYGMVGYFKTITWMTSMSGTMIALFSGLMVFYFYCAILRLFLPRWYQEEDY